MQPPKTGDASAGRLQGSGQGMAMGNDQQKAYFFPKTRPIIDDRLQGDISFSQ